MNPEFRKRIVVPSLIPLGAFVFIGALVFGFSRLLLAVPKDGSVVVGVLMAGCILFAAGALSKGGRLKDSQRVALILFGVLVIGGGVAAGTSLHTREVEGHIAVAETLVAQNTAFDKQQFRLSADTPVGIELVNRDAGLQHNVSIYDSPARGRAIHIGVIFPGVDTRVEELEEGLPTGVYFFQCDVHANIPAMTGNVIVGNAPPPPTPSPTGTATGPTPAPTSPAPSPTTSPT